MSQSSPVSMSLLYLLVTCPVLTNRLAPFDRTTT
jgi:hypothetical protein